MILPGTGPAPSANQFKDFGEAVNPPRVNDSPRLDTKRRQTLLNLLSALNELSQTESLGRGKLP